MDRPRVVVHNTVSLDSRLTGFPVDLSLHYEIAGSIPHDAVLTGSGTLLAAARAEGVDLSGEDPDAPAPGVAADDQRPWLVVVDSRGRLSRLAWLRGQPYWRDVLVLCSQATPVEHVDRLRRHRVEHVVAGTDRVDPSAALRTLVDRYHVTAVRVDAGGTLNGQLLATGLVDELDIVVAPHLAGTGGATRYSAGPRRYAATGPRHRGRRGPAARRGPRRLARQVPRRQHPPRTHFAVLTSSCTLVSWSSCVIFSTRAKPQRSHRSTHTGFLTGPVLVVAQVRASRSSAATHTAMKAMVAR